MFTHPQLLPVHTVRRLLSDRRRRCRIRWRRTSISWIGPGLILAGLIAVAVSALVALPEHGAALRSWIGAPLPGRHERVGALRWWVTPYEPNAFARRFTTTATLNDLAVIDDGRTILVLGDDGTLLVSVNAGATWKSLADNVQWRDGAPLDEPRRGSQPPLVDLEVCGFLA